VNTIKNALSYIEEKDKEEGQPGWSDTAEGIAEAMVDYASKTNNDLLVALEEYIEILILEISGLVPLAVNHGWKSSMVADGENCREKIRRLKDEL
jgi:hypothetical protein